jgi:hypothetical protein
LTPSSSSSASNSSTSTTPSFSSSPKTILKKAVINKKKLEFAALKNQESSDDEEVQNINKLDIESLKSLVEKKREQLAVLVRHQAEKTELIEVTEKWKEAGIEAMNSLRKYVDPPKSDEEILASFKIPHNIFL